MKVKVYYPSHVQSVYPRSVDDAAWQMLKDRLHPEIEFVTGADLPQPADYHILVSGRPTREQLEASPRLHALVIPWAGLPENTAKLMSEYPQITVHNLHHNANATTETALLLLLAAAKRLIPIECRFRENDWRPRYGPNPALLLHGKTALILGYGHIGQHIGRVCQALGMRVLAIRRNPEPNPSDPTEVHPPEALHSLLPQANVLIITLPLTEQTNRMIGEAELALLPGNAILVNVGRGLVVDQGALYHALKSGKLHSAGLDVWYNYPPDEASRANTPPADFPFHELDNVVMSPHRGGGAQEIESIRMAHLAELLNAAARGEPLPNRVDLKKGY